MTKKDMEGLQKIRQISSGFWASRVLLSASHYRLFDYLELPVSTRAVARKLSLDKRALEIVLDALVPLGFIRKSDNKYQNTETASEFLVTGKPYYQGDILRHQDSLWKRWSKLDSVLKTGKPVSGGRDHESFIRGMHNLASLKSEEVVSRITLKRVRKVLDLGGGPGTYSLEFARKGMDVTLCDVKDTFRVSREIVSEAEFKGSIRFFPCNFMTGEIGDGYDLVFMSQILHSFSAEDNVRLLKKISKSLNPGGRVIIQEFVLSDDHTTPVQGALFSVNMLVNTSEGRSYSSSEIASWLKKSGFKVLEKIPLDQTILIDARKII
jgi:ubiquinone/menaquinone biosynthesis C-methylase UbiE